MPENVVRLVRWVFLSYSMFALLSVLCLSLNMSEMVPAIALMWACYAAIRLGTGGSSRSEAIARGGESGRAALTRHAVYAGDKLKPLPACLLSALCLSAAVLVGRHYTGLWPDGVFANLVGVSAGYSQYQQFFAQLVGNRSESEVLIYVALQAVIKFTLVAAFVAILGHRAPRRWHANLLLVTSSTSHLYLGAARGTSYEIFEFILLCLFVMYVRESSQGSGCRLRSDMRRLVVSSSILVAAALVFLINIDRRGVVIDARISADVTLSGPLGTGSALAETLAFVVAVFYGYFGFGFHVTSEFLEQVWLADLGAVFYGLVPGGLNADREAVSRLVDMGPRWVPDGLRLFAMFGLPLFLVFCFLMGVAWRRLLVEASALSRVLSFMILLQVTALPVGNFFWAAAANRVVAAAVATMYLFAWLRGRDRGLARRRTRRMDRTGVA